jgi:Cu-Zn family superoxide dismutase
MNTNTVRILLIAALCAYAPLSLAAPVTVPMHLIDANGTGKSVGTVRAEDSKDGLVLMPKLEGLPPGAHGFHVHENPSCAPMEKDGKKTAGLAAGGHYDPDKSGKHAGPTGKGHVGDLPALTVDDKGMATKRLVAPRLKVADLVGRSLMIHEGGDNYADEPKPLGGGGARIACGVVEK